MIEDFNNVDSWLFEQETKHNFQIEAFAEEAVDQETKRNFQIEASAEEAVECRKKLAEQ